MFMHSQLNSGRALSLPRSVTIEPIFSLYSLGFVSGPGDASSVPPPPSLPPTLVLFLWCCAYTLRLPKIALSSTSNHTFVS